MAPSTEFSFKDGKCVEGIHNSLQERVPILSIGSNRSPYQLKNKFSLNQNLCVTPAILHHSIIVFSASISPYGSIPATQWPLKGAEVNLNVLWLDQRQLNMMHLSEGLGIAYNFVELDKGSVEIKRINYDGPVFGYVSVNGIYNFNANVPKSLSGIILKNSNLESNTQFEALSFLKNQYEPNILNLKDWIKKITQNKKYRLKIVSKMAKTALKPKKNSWKIINIKPIGENYF